MKTTKKIKGVKVEISYDKRVLLTPILIFIEDQITNYNHSRCTPVGFKSFKKL